MSLALEEQLLYVPHHRTRALLASGLPVHVLVNPVEYHGPHLSLGNDRILSERIARRLHARLNAARGIDFPFLVGGVIDFGENRQLAGGDLGLQARDDLRGRARAPGSDETLDRHAPLLNRRRRCGSTCRRA